MSERASTKGRDDELASASYLHELPSVEAEFRSALEEIATFDCGCKPCTGQCRKGEAAEIELEARVDIARAALRAHPPASDAIDIAMKDALACGTGLTITRIDPAEFFDVPESEWRPILAGLVEAMERYGHEVGDGDIPSAHRNLLWRAEQLLGSGRNRADATPNPLSEGRERS